ncbi:hypothetical protein [Streptomyces sp. NPDC059783]|uniref:hypothetical protein n=1 Tax=Streptomyces sp. NPDC059783 TaxID=3346944 RepID=UPI00364E6F79
MTGPEHYRKAEELLAEAASIDGAPAAEVALMAQAHATLALAAATAHHTVPTSCLDRSAWVGLVGREDSDGDVTASIW